LEQCASEERVTKIKERLEMKFNLAESIEIWRQERAARNFAWANVQFGKTVFQASGPLNHGRNFRAIN